MDSRVLLAMDTLGLLAMDSRELLVMVEVLLSQRSQYYSNESYGDGYQDVRAMVDHRAMVHAPAGRICGQGVTSNRFGGGGSGSQSCGTADLQQPQ